MAELSHNLQLRQQQRLVMTPQLKQALKILQLNTMELSSLVEIELEQNPMLEELGVESDVEPADTTGVDGGRAAPRPVRWASRPRWTVSWTTGRARPNRS